MSIWRNRVALTVLGVCLAGAVMGDDWRYEGRGSPPARGEWKEEYRDGPCWVKEESRRGEFKKEIKCKDGVGADWHGDWKREFWDGPCRVTIDAKRDEYKEEVKCDERR